jgi:hypothetical protein
MTAKAFCKEICILAVVVFNVSVPGRAQSGAQETEKPRKVESESQYGNAANPVQRTETHEQSGNRTVDKSSMKRMGSNGQYEPFMDVETETVKVNAGTTRVVTRTYGRGSNGERNLIQVQEEEKQDLPNGGSKSVRTNSAPDAGGRLQLVQREVEETRATGANTQEKKTTLFMNDSYSTFAPVKRTVEIQTKTGENASQYRTSVESPDLSGKWQVTETREGKIRQAGQEKTTDETLSRSDANGVLSVAGRTVRKEGTDKSGDTRSTVEEYSDTIPGSSPDGKLHLNQRVTTVKKSGEKGSKTEQQVENRNPGSPNDGLRVSTKTIDIVRAGQGGTSQTRTTQTLNGSGNLAVVEVDTVKTEPSPAVKVEIAPTKPK